MDKRITTSISLPETLSNAVGNLAEQLLVSQNELVEMAIAAFVEKHQGLDASSGVGREAINQGDIFWVTLEDGIPHPHVIVQDDVLNHSRLQTVVAGGLTSNIKRASVQGNVLLEIGEGNLTRQSVVEVSKVSTVGKLALGDYIGSLDKRRMEQILDGMRFLQTSYFA
jgi:mRNA interferase MazF